MPLGVSWHTPKRPTPSWRLYVAMGTAFLLVTLAAYSLNNTTMKRKDWLRFRNLTQRILVYSPLQADDLLQGILGRETPPPIALRIFTGTELTPDHLLYTSAPNEATAFTASPFISVRTIDVAGQPWSIAFAALQPFSNSSAPLPLLLLLSAIGLFFSFIAFWTVRSPLMAAPTPSPADLGRAAAARFRALSAVSGFLTLGVGAIVYVGWRFDIPLLTSISPHFATMKANTAVGFMLAGVALVRLQSRRAPCRFGYVCAALVTLLGMLTLVEYALGTELGIDHLFFKEALQANASPYPGRMSVFTAFNFFCFGVALLVLEVTLPRGPQPSEYCALPGLVISLLTCMQYIYGAESFAGLAPAFTTPAFHTAVTFFLFGGGILLARPERGMMAVLSSATDGGRLGRHLLLATLALLVLLAWLEQQGVRTGLYSERFGLAVFTVSLATLLALLVLLQSNSLYRVALQRQREEVALRQSEEQLRTIVEAMPIPVLISRLSDGLILYANAHHSAMLGLSAETVVGRTSPDFYDDPADRQTFLEALQTRGRLHNYEFRGKKATGTPFWVVGSFQCTQFNGEQAVIGGLYDITERKRTEEALQRTAAELARSNADLEQFAYVASHDLQEPLRAVAGCVQLLQQGYAGKFDARADELIGHVVAGATRMRNLINDLLTYARVTTRRDAFAPVNCSTVLHQVLANLQTSIAESGAAVTCDPLPTVRADATQLLQVLQNLLSNAIKFRTEKPPVIHIAVKRQVDAWLLSVCDNGIGLEPQYAERIFGIFQRLHTQTEYPGTGIGLALCKKIVEHHGGRMWVCSEVGQGATFYCTLPDQAT